jgi:hypothetical protein
MAPMMLVLMERAKPAGFDLGNADEVAWHCRRAVQSIAASGGEVHWLTTYATEDDRLLGVLAIEGRAALDAYLARAGVAGEVKLTRIVRRLDPSMAAPAAGR